MIGGGNYLEAESLSCWAGRAQPTPKHVVYGATELLRLGCVACPDPPVLSTPTHPHISKEPTTNRSRVCVVKPGGCS